MLAHLNAAGLLQQPAGKAFDQGRRADPTGQPSERSLYRQPVQIALEIFSSA